MKRTSICVLLLALVGAASAAVFFEEKFDDGAAWEKRWVKSSWKVKDGTAGDWTLTPGKWFGDAKADAGIQTGPDARFFAIGAPFKKPVDTDGKTLVLQFSVKHEQKLDCGGGYIKLLPKSSKLEDFGGDTPYSIMFGPDICGFSTKKVHVILTKGDKNHLTKKDIPCETDELTHVYTLVLKPDNSYEVLVDLASKHNGTLYEDFDILPAKTIKDPKAVKPEDWDERATIPDETDVKPEGYDDIPAKIVDADAKKPEDWDDEEDGTWEAPMISNPEYKGPWKQKTIPNPAYKGIWVAPDIPNPEFKDDPKMYAFKDLGAVGIELWQVKAGSLFDNVLVTDDLAYAKKLATDTWGKSKDAEKAAHDAVVAKEAEEAAAKAKEAAKDEPAEDDDEDDEAAHDEL